MLIIASVVATPTAAMAANVDGNRIINADSEPGSWMSHGRTYSEQRFSPLAKINKDNIGKLGLAWSHDVVTRTKRGMEATPIVVDGVMYTTTAWSHVLALDPVTGKVLWEFDPEIEGAYAAKGCCGVINRGVAVWNGKVYLGAFDGRLIALNAKTGKVVWQTLTVDQKMAYTITGAPRVVNGKVIIGNGGAEFGVRGYVSAYDAETGKQVWRFYTVPGNPKNPQENEIHNKTLATWTGEWWKYGGGGTVWDSLAYDAEQNLLFVGVGNGSPWNRAIRSPGGGDNLFLSSIVAVDADTGKYRWHYQTTPGEEWDYTATQHMILAELEIEGKVRKVLMQAPKNGFFYVLDRVTGELISGKNYVTTTWASVIDPFTGRPVVNPAARYSITGKAVPQFPSPFGGHNWQPMSYSPNTGYVYIPAMEIPFAFPPAAKDAFNYEPNKIDLGIDMAQAAMPEDLNIRKAIRGMIKGSLIAWDPVAGKSAWSVDQPVPWNGGLLSTASDLIFQGDGQGNFKARDAKTGEEVWSFFAQTGIVAAPISYEIDGQQYVSVLAGWGGAVPAILGEAMSKAARGKVNRILTFKIGANKTLPELETVVLKLNPPANFGDQKILKTGLANYQDHCFGCHGDTAVTGSLIPDLRYSERIGNAESFRSVVLDGALQNNGMPNFSKYLKAENVEAIRAYIVHRANQAKVANQTKIVAIK